MPTLTIDGRSMTVPEGTLVIEAAEALGIMIPRFCYLKALGNVGACRMCAVMFTQGPVPGLAMSCMTTAADGMVVETGHPEAVAFRRQVIEWLMINHPHDCPVCDEGGHCLLQDETISGNHGLRRYPGKKRTYADQDLGPFIAHEMNRCIHCYRCSRFYQDYAGYRDFGPMQIGNRVYFGRFVDGRLESPFSGNLADICPTGVLTDKTARYKARRWDLERAPSVCPHCSLGCNTVVSARYREVVRVEARPNARANGWFLCDRGRFSHGFASSPERPRQALADGQETPLAEAVQAAARRLALAIRRYGASAVACLGSPRASLEALSGLKRLAEQAGFSGPAHFPDPATRVAVRAAVASLDPKTPYGLTDIEASDAVLCAGVDPLADAPVLALALRQAARKGALVVVADPRPVSLPLPFLHLPAAPADLPACLDLLADLATTPGADLAALCQKRLPARPDLAERLADAAAALAGCRKPAIVAGTRLGGPALPREAALAARRLAAAKGECGQFFVLPGPNACGAALVEAPDAPSLAELVEDIHAGRIRAVIALEADFFAAVPSPAKLHQAVAGLESLVVIDHLPTETAAMADVFLPSQPLFEAGGTFVNSAGRLQRAAPAYACGLPVFQDGGGGHPPRDYARELPGTEPGPAFELLCHLGARLGYDLGPSPAPVMIGASVGLSRLDPAATHFDGIQAGPLPFEILPVAFPYLSSAPGGLAVIFTDTLFGTEELGRYAPLVRGLAEPATACLHPADAAAFGLADGDTAWLDCCDEEVTLTVVLNPSVARGVAVLPRLPSLAHVPPVLGPGCFGRR